jgi:hypothetical protein
MIEVQIDNWVAKVYLVTPASEDQNMALGIPHSTMTLEYVVPLDSIKDIFPKMTIAHKLETILIGVKMIDQNREKAKLAAEQEADDMI